MTDVGCILAGLADLSLGMLLMRSAENRGVGAVLIGSSVLLIIPSLIRLFGPVS